MNTQLRKSVVRLYYLIKKAHLSSLPEKPRVLGDLFVHKEFKDHLNNTDPKFMKGFLEQWIDYYQLLVNSKSFTDFARDIDQDKAKLFSPEQAETLEKIKDSIK